MRQITDIFIPATPKTGADSRKRKLVKALYQAVSPRNLRQLRRLHRKSVAVTVVFHFTSECSADLDNLLKGLLDALQGHILENDRQVKAINARIIEADVIEG